MSEFEFWTQVYRAVMMLAKAIVRYKLTKAPEGQRAIIGDNGLIAGIPGYDIDTAPEKV